MGDGHQESLNLSFLTPRQGIRIEGSPARITVITDVDDDGCDRSWNHLMSANLSDEFAVISDSILESANIHPKEPLQHRGPKS